MHPAKNYVDLDLPYFGYATLLGHTQMRAQYPSAEKLGLAILDHHELAFWRYADATDGGCTIVYNPDSILFGSLYRLSKTDLSKLLEVGGLAEWYELRELEVRRVSGGSVRAFTLRVEGYRGPWAPPAPYGGLVTNGAAEAGLPAEYQEKLREIVDLAANRG